MKIRAIKTLVAFNNDQLDIQVNAFYERNPTIEFVEATSYGIDLGIRGVMFCHTITGLVEYEPEPESIQDTKLGS